MNVGFGKNPSLPDVQRTGQVSKTTEDIWSLDAMYYDVVKKDDQKADSNPNIGYPTVVRIVMNVYTH